MKQSTVGTESDATELPGRNGNSGQIWQAFVLSYVHVQSRLERDQGCAERDQLQLSRSRRHCLSCLPCQVHGVLGRRLEKRHLRSLHSICLRDRVPEARPASRSLHLLDGQGVGDHHDGPARCLYQCRDTRQKEEPAPVQYHQAEHDSRPVRCP